MGTITSSSKVNWAEYSERPAIRSLWHMSFRCFDAEETRAFYEDFLGLEFCAALPYQVKVDGKLVDAMHILFRMADGDCIGFYDIPDNIRPELFVSLDPMELHLGMKVSSEAELNAWSERMLEQGFEFLGPLDHDMVRSIYFRDPNGLWMEINYEVPNHEEIMARERSGAKERLDAWTIQSVPKKEKFRKIA